MGLIFWHFVFCLNKFNYLNKTQNAKR